MTSRTRQALFVCAALLLLAACSGPEIRGRSDSTATPLPATPTEEAQAPTETPPEETATPEPTVAPTSTPEPTPTPTEEPLTATPEPEPTATPLPIDLDASLPEPDQLPIPGYFLADRGSRSALDLANSYSDSSAHLERLNNWGFIEHHFREFARDEGGDGPEPYYVLVTVNEYGSPEQATDALNWLRSLNASQGHVFVDPAPAIGEGTSASTVETVDGVATAFVAVQIGARVYVYFAQGGEPLDFCLEIAGSNTERIGAPVEPPEEPADGEQPEDPSDEPDEEDGDPDDESDDSEG